ncbi:hypothetical protein [Spirosoma areae]
MADHAFAVTTVLKINYKEGCKDECVQWMLETASIARNFEGFVEKSICISAEVERELVNIFTFSNNQYLQAWENSTERIQQTKKGERFIEAIQAKSQLAGLEFMFPAVRPPKKWKMVLITICVIFILLNTLIPILQQVFDWLHIPALLRSLFGVVVMVSLMTFLLLPFLTKLFGQWLAR